MKTINFLSIAIVFSLVIISKSYAVFITDESAALDWSKFSYSGDISISRPQSGVQVQSNLLKTINSFGDVSDTFSGSGLSAHAATTANLVIADIAVQSNNETKAANATAFRGFEFAALSRGTVSFSVPYELKLNASSASQGESYTGLATVFALLDNNATQTLEDRDSDELQSQLENLALSDTGTLTVSHDFNAGDTGFFSVFAVVAARVDAAEPVPEPASLMLFGFGLLGLLGVSRKS